MPQIEKPSAAGIAEGFLGLNSVCDTTQSTIIPFICGLRKKPSSVVIPSKPEQGTNPSHRLDHSYLKEKGGNDGY